MPSIFFVEAAQKNTAEVNSRPDLCPWCHKRCIANQIDGRYIPEKRKDVEMSVQATFQCPNNECGRLFFADYARSASLAYDLDLDNNTFVLLETWPTNIDYSTNPFPDSVKKLSPRFCRVYIQALEAQVLKLDEIAGPGFRKALEILIKDYLVSLEPDKKDIILDMQLGNCIANKVTDQYLKVCAERAAWLGNDEVHYVRDFTEHDVEDLKQLIRLAVNWIDSSQLTKHYQENMQKVEKEKKPQKNK
jgi:hypothetical protein